VNAGGEETRVGGIGGHGVVRKRGDAGEEGGDLAERAALAVHES
jgi:hypothetical protein